MTRGGSQGRAVAVTGSSGMGLATALRLAREGAVVHLCGIDERLNAEAARRPRGSTCASPAWT